MRFVKRGSYAEAIKLKDTLHLIGEKNGNLVVPECHFLHSCRKTLTLYSSESFVSLDNI